MSKTVTGSAGYLFYACRAQVGNPLAKLILIALADRANDQGECWPSMDTIAEQCETSRSTVIRKIQLLVNSGHINRVNRAVDGVKTSNLYRINTDVSQRHYEVSERHQGSVTVTHKAPNEAPSIYINKASGFDEFWKAYPRKTGKQSAHKAWAKIKPDLLPTILADIEARLESQHWRPDTDKQYIPHPATYLNGERWTDELITRNMPHEKTNRPIGNRQDTRRLSAGDRVRAATAARRAEHDRQAG